MKRKRTNLKRYVRDRWMSYVVRSYKRDMHNSIIIINGIDVNLLGLKSSGKVFERNDDEHFNKNITYLTMP